MTFHIQVNGVRKAIRIMEKIAADGCWFEFLPLGKDRYDISVNEENAGKLRRLLVDSPLRTETFDRQAVIDHICNSLQNVDDMDLEAMIHDLYPLDLCYERVHSVNTDNDDDEVTITFVVAAPEPTKPSTSTRKKTTRKAG